MRAMARRVAALDVGSSGSASAAMRCSETRTRLIAVTM